MGRSPTPRGAGAHVPGAYQQKLRDMAPPLQSAVQNFFDVAMESPSIPSAQAFLTVANQNLLVCCDLKYKSDTMKDTIRGYLKAVAQLKAKMQEGFSYGRCVRQGKPLGKPVPVSPTSPPC